MINNELKKLSRRELVDIIYKLKMNEQKMQEEIASLEEALEEKRIKMSKAGSIAEVAVSVTDLLSTAQSTADLYLHEIEHMKAETEKECRRKLEEADEKAAKAISEGEKKLEDLKAQCEKEHERLQCILSEKTQKKKSQKKQKKKRS